MITIVLGEDMDGLLGNDPDEIAKIDVSSSQEQYENMVYEAIRKFHPEIDEVIFDWSVYGKTNLNEIEDEQEREWLFEDLQMIEDTVYNSQDFWVLKE